MSRRTHNLKPLAARRLALRHRATSAENRLWACLKRKQLLGRKFRRQYSVGPYVLDFYCVAESLAVELDGDVHNDPARRDYDAMREAYLREQGITMLRFENRRVFDDFDNVLAAIVHSFADRPDDPGLDPDHQNSSPG